MSVRSVLLGVAGFVSLAGTAAAADWPQWMGPNRDNVWAEDGVLDALPKDGPKVVWRAPVTIGYAGPAVALGKVFCQEYKSAVALDPEGKGNFGRTEADGTETVFALDQATGKRAWEHSYPVRYTISYPAGPRCTPTVSGGKVYFLGAEGLLTACDAAAGTVVWQKDLKAVYKTKSALWGYTAHPLIDGQKLITLAGGEGSHVVALDKDTGNEIWKSQSQGEQGYSPPLLTTAAGVRQLIVPGPSAVRGLNPDTGERLWTTPYDATSGSIIMTPVRVGDYVFVGGYQNKNLLLKLTADKPGVEVVSKDVRNKFVSPVNAQPLVIDDVVYGMDGDGSLTGFALPAGDRLFTSAAPLTGDAKLPTGTAFFVRQGAAGRVWAFTEQGDLVLGKLSKTGFEEISRSHLLDTTGKAFGRKVLWSVPAFADRKVFARNDKELVAFDLAK